MFTGCLHKFVNGLKTWTEETPVDEIEQQSAPKYWQFNSQKLLPGPWGPYGSLPLQPAMAFSLRKTGLHVTTAALGPT